jgi:arginyl-tRNA synthetase
VDPIAVLQRRFATAIKTVYGEAHATMDPLIQRSDRADLQANVALPLAKKVGKNPREVATALLEALQIEDVVAKAELAGAGFINMTLRSSWIAQSVSALLGDDRLGVLTAARPDTVVIDYSAPNVAKEMHVGHLRSTVIGDALARLLEFRGHTVIRQNHVGDWGTPFGMLIEHLLDLGESRAATEASVGELGAFYREARGKFDASESFQARARARVVLLQSGDAETLRLWKKLVEISASYFAVVYEQLRVTLKASDIAGESFYNDMLEPVAHELEARGIATHNNGALCVFAPGFKNREGEPLPLIVRKSDEGFGYPATDLAAIRYRVETLKATRILYVVGHPQEQHFAMVFAVAKMAGWLTEATKVEHVAFGSILGTDKRMFRSREGATARLIDLIEAAQDSALKVVQQASKHLTEEQQVSISRKVGTGAIKYADLSNDRIKDYVFDTERMVSTDGNTASYLQYAHARFRSILSKAESAGHSVVSPHTVLAIAEHPAEKALAMHLLQFGAVIENVERSLHPHKLCTYLYELSAKTSTFWNECRVIDAEEPARSGRIALVRVTADILQRGLELLGIETPVPM